jgi:hypothetical protein
MRRTITITMLLSLLIACGGKEQTATNASPAAPVQTAKATALTPEELGELGAQINHQPERATELLAHHGMTTETFEKQIRQVTQDPQASRRYADAFKRAKV